MSVDLSPQTVETILRDCLFQDDEPTEDAVFAEGVTAKFGFHPGRLESHRQEIHDLLAELPDTFRTNSGGGWSFLNACEDRHGRQWTGEQRIIELLLVLGIAIGQAHWLLPRAYWVVQPGGMPYVAVDV